MGCIGSHSKANKGSWRWTHTSKARAPGLLAEKEALSREDYSSFERPSIRPHRAGWFFLPVFKKLKAAFKKTQANFWQKTQGYGGNFGYQEKNSKIFDRYIQNIFKSSWDFQ